MKYEAYADDLKVNIPLNHGGHTDVLHRAVDLVVLWTSRNKIGLSTPIPYVHALKSVPHNSTDTLDNTLIPCVSIYKDLCPFFHADLSVHTQSARMLKGSFRLCNL